MIFSHIDFKNFKIKKKNLRIKKYLQLILKNEDSVISSLGNGYRLSFNKIKIIKYKKFLSYRLIGMGGSSLGAQAIYEFLKKKLKRNLLLLIILKLKILKIIKLNF